ncbi:hypothetical protein PG993_014016 [Apiospora rasikravindrae]|uniref:Uncharacterized protein n=1 Tax=Apiospora rasikravindrae TaxID=990691 RepID=A0ABR1RTC7_9PEZI
MEANKNSHNEQPGAAAAQQDRSARNFFVGIFETSKKTIEIEVKDLEDKVKAWRDNDDDDKNASFETKIAVSRGHLKEDVDNAARVIRRAEGYAGVRAEAAELMRFVRNVRKEHLGEGTP